MLSRLLAAGQREVAGDRLSVTQDRQASLDATGQLLLGHGVSSVVGDPECQPSPSVPYRSWPVTLMMGVIVVVRAGLDLLAVVWMAPQAA